MPRSDMVSRWALAGIVTLSSQVAAATDVSISIEKLLSEGWEIAGYTGTFDNRSSLMLWKHKDRNYLVQCAVLYDVTRAQRTVVNCYELR